MSMSMSLRSKTFIKRNYLTKPHSGLSFHTSNVYKPPTKLDFVLFQKKQLNNHGSFSAIKFKPRPFEKQFRLLTSSSSSKPSPSSLVAKSKKTGEPFVSSSIATAFGHGAFVLTGLAYVTKDMLGLRLLVIGGISTSMIFQYCRPKPLWLPLKWNALFLTINVIMTGLLLQERREANEMGDELLSIYEKGSFETRGFSKVEFYRLFKIAKKIEKRQGDLLKQSGTRNNTLYFIEKGDASIVREGSILANISNNDFSGEMEFICSMSLSSDEKQKNSQSSLSNNDQLVDDKLEQIETSGDVSDGKKTMTEEETTISSEDVIITSPTMTVWCWDYLDLKELLKSNRGVSNALLAYASHELREKLVDSWILRLKMEEENQEIKQSALNYLIDGVVLGNDLQTDEKK